MRSHSFAKRFVFGGDPFVLLILNQRLHEESFRHLWPRANAVICADGGGNRLHDFCTEAERARFVPELICGDLDSLRPNVRTYYESLGTTVMESADQDSTDFDKCLAALSARKEYQSLPVVALGALGGRFDHVLAAIQTIHRSPDREIFLVNEETVAFLLGPGSHTVELDQRFEGPSIGLLPFCGPIKMTTEGLKWNLTDAECRFGQDGLVSTSNRPESGRVTVSISSCDASQEHFKAEVTVAIWTMELRWHLLPELAQGSSG